MVAKWRLIRQVLVSGHRCSAGCNSGEYGGRKSRCTCSGTRKRRLVCQPARSSTSTICLWGLAPTVWAKAASSASKSGMRDAGRQVKDRATRGGMDKADDVAPGKAMPHDRCGSLANRGPHSTQQRFQADSVFIHRPQLYPCRRKRGRDRTYQGAQVFLKSACASGSARACWGRGTCRLCLSLTR